MTHEDISLLIPQYLSGGLTEAERALLEAELSRSGELRGEVEELRAVWEGLALIPGEQPSAALRARFYQRLAASERNSRLSLRGAFTWWKPRFAVQFAVALAIFFCGAYVGHLRMGEQVASGEVAQLRTQVRSLHETVALSLLERQSAASRLEGVSWGSRVEQPDGELLAALTRALNHDPNTNVRLASLDALEKFGGEEAVRSALVNSLAMQDSPLVQIALIDALVHLRDRSAAGQFRKLTADRELNSAVRQRAQWGIEKLTFQ